MATGGGVQNVRVSRKGAHFHRESEYFIGSAIVSMPSNAKMMQNNKRIMKR